MNHFGYAKMGFLGDFAEDRSRRLAQSYAQINADEESLVGLEAIIYRSSGTQIFAA